MQQRIIVTLTESPVVSYHDRLSLLLTDHSGYLIEAMTEISNTENRYRYLLVVLRKECV